MNKDIDPRGWHAWARPRAADLLIQMPQILDKCGFLTRCAKQILSSHVSILVSRDWKEFDSRHLRQLHLSCDTSHALSTKAWDIYQCPEVFSTYHFMVYPWEDKVIVKHGTLY